LRLKIQILNVHGILVVRMAAPVVKRGKLNISIMMLTFLWFSCGSSHENSVFVSGSSAIDSDDIAGVVTSDKGTQVGVWVIAETKDLPTPFARIVVTDEQGRYVLPDLPKAHYKVWVRGYGLVDSKPVEAVGGETVNLSVALAPTARVAAELYPAQYWSALLPVPAASEFPGTGTGPRGNGISQEMHTQQEWLVHLEENCMVCHQLGDKATRELPNSDHSILAWKERLGKVRPPADANIGSLGPFVATLMNERLTELGSERALRMFAAWTDGIASGKTPIEAPARPSGIERNVVVTVRDYGRGTFTRDPVASDRRDPTVNAGGLIYGMASYHGSLEALDPVANRTISISIPGIDGSPYDATMAPHHAQMDAKGRVWVAMVSKVGAAPAFCTDGSTPFSKYFPYVSQTGDVEMAENGSEVHAQAQPIVMYDPETGKASVIPLCAGSNHISIGWDQDTTAYLSGDSTVISWLKTKVWDDTHDLTRAHGWCPMVLDTNGDGKITPDRNQWNHWGEPINAKNDTEFQGYLYGINVGKDGTVWAAGYLPLMPSSLVRFQAGKHPPETCLTEVYNPPMEGGRYSAYGLRGVSVDSDGVAWAAFASGHIGAFDRRKCKTIRGPSAVGQQCPEGWKIYRLPGPMLSGTDVTANIAYGAPIDFGNVFGLGANTVFFPTMNTDAILALDRKTEQFRVFRVPYPMGFYARDLQFRIDDAKKGWKGRAIWGGYTQVAMWHQEERDGAFSEISSKIVSFQLRPDPLAH
jgi:streptogramin lyase